jgi:2-dehydropantoate 2-reductase
MLATNAAITAATRNPLGVLRDDPDIFPLFGRAAAEVAAVARAKGVKIPDNAAESVVDFTRNAPPAVMASMAHDLIRGSRIELPWLSGKVVSLGRELGVPTPVHEILYAVLKPFVQGRPT